MKLHQMQLCAVALVLAEAVLRKDRTEVTHHSIAADLGDHARGRDAKADAVAIDDRCLWKREWVNWKTVDQNMIRGRSNRLDCEAHRLVSGAQDVDLIDFHVIDHADRPGDFSVNNQLPVNRFAELGRELFGILQFPMPELFRKKNRSSDDWAGQSTAASFVNAGDAGDANGAKFFFVT